MSSPDLDAMTKDELLEHAQRLGVTPANKNMSKTELRDAIDQHESEPGVEGQATTTANKDYMGRALITPSVNSKDYLGRPTLSSVDYLGRLLVL
jgi:hypothetical protein